MKRTRHLIAAAGAASLACLGASTADAGLMWDVRTIGSTGATILDPKTVVFHAPGETITLGLFAHVAGTNGVNDESFKSGYGLLNSVGALKGDLSGGYVPLFFSAGVSQNGSVIDWDSDGDLDIGLSPTNSSVTGKFAGRTPVLVSMPSIGGSLQIGEFVFTYTGGGPDLSINFTPRNNNGNNVNAAALWFEDSSTISKNPTLSPMTVGLPVTTIPEPATLGLLALGGIGLMKRRR